MWLATKIGFFSIVHKEFEGEPSIFIRARVRKDLERLKELTDLKSPVRSWPGADYRYRLIVPPHELRHVMLCLADGVDYPNFKSECAKGPQAAKLHAYHGLWQDLYDLQSQNESNSLAGTAGKGQSLTKGLGLLPSERLAKKVANLQGETQHTHFIPVKLDKVKCADCGTIIDQASAHLENGEHFCGLCWLDARHAPVDHTKAIVELDKIVEENKEPEAKLEPLLPGMTWSCECGADRASQCVCDWADIDTEVK